MVNLRMIGSYRVGSTTYYAPTTEIERVWRLGFHVPLLRRMRTPTFYWVSK